MGWSCLSTAGSRPSEFAPDARELEPDLGARIGACPHSRPSPATSEKTMSYAIIGFGKIGQALAKAFARNGIEVSVATTRDPESFASDAAAIGPTIIPKTLADAVKADIVFLAVRFEAHQNVAKALP